MSRPYYDLGHGGGIPDYYASASDHPPLQQSRIPRPHDRMRQQPSMTHPNYPAAHNARSPRRPHEPQLQQNYLNSNSNAWEISQNMYDGSAYDYQEVDTRNDQWPLPAQPHASSSPARGSPRRPPQRPQRPDEQPQRPHYPQAILDQPRSHYVASPARQYRQPAPPPASHHGTGQWNGEGYSYAAPPPNFPPPSRPLPQSQTPSSIPTYAAPQAPQQAVYGRANQRPPLGPPPSARRGPSSYYPQVAPVMPIAEETDSMRGSSLRTGSVHTGAHDSKTSFASSNAIPIGISQLHLERGREAGHQPLQRPDLLSESDEDEDFDDSPTEPAIARGEIRTPDPHQQYRENSSPEVTVVRQASLGKKSKPTLTTVTSSDRVRKSSGSIAGDPKSGIASLPSQQPTVPETVSTPERTERSRALAQERLEGQTRPGAATEPIQKDNQIAAPAVAVSTAAGYMQQPESKPTSGKQTPEEVLRSGTGLIDASDSSESEGNELRRKRSKDLLGAELANQLHPVRSQPRSPLAPAVDPRVESIIGSLEKGGALSAQEAQELKQPMGGLSADRAGKRRPPRINVDAVRDAEARGSLTSLPDLIRRATKLASNLDRGKTASRLGMNWLDGAADGEKRRSGSMSDVLAFPPPALATPPESRNGRWSSRFRHSQLPSDSDAGGVKRRRKCCGMPVWAFWVLMVLLFLLVAAAVIVPVVLIVIPKQNDNTSTKVGACEQKLTCNNGGTNILSSSGYCECLCINGYTGLTCSVFSDAGCTRTSVGSSDNATVGDAIPRLISGAESNFSIPLDAQELLGLFSSSDMDCSLQNNLVTFNSKSQKRAFLDTLPGSASLRAINRRQDGDSPSSSAAATSHGIVYASGTPTATATATSTSSTDSKTLDFARVAVLYIFQSSQELTIAADAQENLQAFLRTGSTSSSVSTRADNVTLGNGFTADLTSYTISVGNGTTVGGTGNNDSSS
ncbi:uncharacterized protein MYCFIDRAFT_214377 [Pseudocercospora fijiensis CIRAD86]|uniref:EGF-like domain-containing protein n=1 Tax=Pseudocercospora fijiensis (strain CIRAD86) TaxID=383855 RepID=M3BCA2_PSEFD|nr:uncharacterized protein MYCFIDRAFT_214377 [Pseudocercospora fijiensis CIRAD86]EME86783.1 hypothetical protein MYCFIDRAFT_214377 [Pseudocercospora fijiensis CIRAD86]